MPIHTPKYFWSRSLMILLLMGLLLPTGSAFAQTPTSNPFAKSTPINGFHSQKLTATKSISPLSNSSTRISHTSISPAITTGNIIQDPSFEASYGSEAYWGQTSYQFDTPLCTVANCGVV